MGAAMFLSLIAACLYSRNQAGRSIFSHMLPPGLLSPCSTSPSPSTLTFPDFGPYPASSRAISSPSHQLHPPSAELFRLLDLDQRLVVRPSRSTFPQTHRVQTRGRLREQ